MLIDNTGNYTYSVFDQIFDPELGLQIVFLVKKNNLVHSINSPYEFDITVAFYKNDDDCQQITIPRKTKHVSLESFFERKLIKFNDQVEIVNEILEVEEAENNFLDEEEEVPSRAFMPFETEFDDSFEINERDIWIPEPKEKPPEKSDLLSDLLKAEEEKQKEARNISTRYCKDLEAMKSIVEKFILIEKNFQAEKTSQKQHSSRHCINPWKQRKALFIVDSEILEKYELISSRIWLGILRILLDNIQGSPKFSFTGIGHAARFSQICALDVFNIMNYKKSSVYALMRPFLVIDNLFRSLTRKRYSDSSISMGGGVEVEKLEKTFENVSCYSFSPQVCIFGRKENIRAPFQLFAICLAIDDLRQLSPLNIKADQHLSTNVIILRKGDFVLHPDPLECSIIIGQNRNDSLLNTSREERYILSLMQWSSRAFYTFSTRNFLQFWRISCFQALKHQHYGEKSSVRTYFEEVYDDSAILDKDYSRNISFQLKLKELKDFQGKECFCVISCGVPGDSSSWEIYSSSVQSSPGGFEGPQDSRRNLDGNEVGSNNDEIVRKETDSVTSLNVSHSTLSDALPYNESIASFSALNTDLKDISTSHSENSLQRRTQTSTSDRSYRSETVSSLIGDMEVSKPVFYSSIEFLETDVFIFGQRQVLIPGSRVTIALIDAAEGKEVLGTASFSLEQLLSVKQFGKQTNEETELLLPFGGRDYKLGIIPKVAVSVKSVGMVPLSSWSSSCNLRGDELDTLQFEEGKQNSTRISVALANFCLQKSINREQTNITLKVGLARVRFRFENFVKLPLFQDLPKTVRDESPQLNVLFFVEVSVGEEHGLSSFVEHTFSGSESLKEFQPSFNSSFVFAHSTSLSGFETINITLKARVSTIRNSVASGTPTHEKNKPGKLWVLGKMVIKFHTLLRKFTSNEDESQNLTQPFLRWFPIQHVRKHRSQNSRSSDGRKRYEVSNLGSLCTIFQLASVSKDEYFNSPHTNFSSALIGTFGLRNKGLMRRKLRSASLTFRKTDSSSPTTDSSDSVQNKSPLNTAQSNTIYSTINTTKSLSKVVKQTSMPLSWLELCEASLDERRFIIDVEIFRCNLFFPRHEVNQSTFGETVIKNSPDRATLKIRRLERVLQTLLKGQMNSFCRVEIKTKDKKKTIDMVKYYLLVILSSKPP
eukprot:augustus_masked-scaffold_8-processed-gene-4.45-mRNA-1 protein AED:1.00 eAED:1.00 QI:0/-1/0/0/-1/1/1/0/1164